MNYYYYYGYSSSITTFTSLPLSSLASLLVQGLQKKERKKDLGVLPYARIVIFFHWLIHSLRRTWKWFWVKTLSQKMNEQEQDASY